MYTEFSMLWKHTDEEIKTWLNKQGGKIGLWEWLYQSTVYFNEQLFMLPWESPIPIPAKELEGFTETIEAIRYESQKMYSTIQLFHSAQQYNLIYQQCKKDKNKLLQLKTSLYNFLSVVYNSQAMDSSIEKGDDFVLLRMADDFLKDIFNAALLRVSPTVHFLIELKERSGIQFTPTSKLSSFWFALVSNAILKGECPQYPRICQSCGVVFIAGRPEASFCSDNCRNVSWQRNYRRRKGASTKRGRPKGSGKKKQHEGE
ncbi:MAG: hypothetical protein ACOY3U_07985 [Bacillota bacterium]